MNVQHGLIFVELVNAEIHLDLISVNARQGTSWTQEVSIQWAYNERIMSMQ